MNKKGNTSSAVMQQRHVSTQGLDDFPTPPWATRAFLHHILSPLFEPALTTPIREMSVWEPACNRGYMARPLGEYFAKVWATDIRDYGWVGMDAVADFLTFKPAGEIDWIITNPPFAKAQDFVERCIALRPRRGFALLARLALLEGCERYEQIYAKHPPAMVVQYGERVPMCEGRYDPQGSTATPYAWFVWRTGFNGDPVCKWIPPGQKDRFKRPTDVAFDQGDARDWISEACEATPLFAKREG